MRLFGQAFHDAFLHADAIQVISTFLGKWAKQKGFTGEPILVPNAVDTARFTQVYQKEEIDAVRHELGVAQDSVLLVTTSRLVEKNATDVVIRALAELPEKYAFIIFGTGPDEEMLRSLVKQLKLESRVVFYGHLDHAVMPKYLKACDIFIRPSRSEGMGNSFVEAMAAEIPVIATQEGGIADFLFDASKNPGVPATGFAVAVDSPQEIKAAVLRIVGDAEATTRTVETAKAMALSKYDWNLIASRMDTEVFAPLISKE